MPSKYRVTTDYGVYEITTDEGETAQPGFGARMAEGSHVIQAAQHPLDTVASVLGIDKLKGAADAYQKGDKQGAAMQVLQFASHALPSAQGEGLVKTGTEQLGKSWDAIKQGVKALAGGNKEEAQQHFDRAIAHGGAAILPVLAPTGNASDLLQQGDTVGGLGLVAGNALDLAAPKIAGKVVDIASRPGAGKVAGGAALTAGGVGTALAGHPIIGTEMAVGGIGLARKGVQQMRSATVPPAEVPPPLNPSEVAMTEGLRKLAQPDNHFAPIPPELPRSTPISAQPPQLPAQPPSLPVQVQKSAVQPTEAPAVDMQSATMANRAADSGIKNAQAEIRMLENKKGLSGAQQQRLDMLKGIVSRETPTSPASTGAAPPQEPAISSDLAPQGAMTPAAELAQVLTGSPEGGKIPFSKETDPSEAFAAQKRAARAPKVAAIVEQFKKTGISSEMVDSMQPGQWRDVAKALKVDLPKDLKTTIRDVKKALAPEDKVIWDPTRGHVYQRTGTAMRPQ